MLRIGIVGCGRIVRLAHLRVLQTAPDVQVVALADPDPDARAWAARTAPAATTFDDFRELLALPGLDAVVVAAPTLQHREVAVAAFRRGLHVYLEKPIAAARPDAEAIIAAWRDAGTVGVIGFNCRSSALYRQLRSRIREGAIGAPVAVRSALVARWPGESTWRLSPSSGGGALLELASHHVDLCRFIFDAEIEGTEAVTWTNREEDEAAMLCMRLSSGVHVQTLVAYGTIEEDRFEVYGTEGKLVVNRYDSLVVEHVPVIASGGLTSALRHAVREFGAIGYGLEKRSAPGQEPSYRDALLAFVEAARASRQGSPDLEDGLRALSVIENARASSRRPSPR